MSRPSLRNEHTKTLTELDRYKLLVENVQDYAIFFMDADGYIQTWNKGAEKNKGYTRSEIVGQHFSIFYMPEDIAEKKPQRELVIAKKLGRVEDEDWRVRKDGTMFWANVVITSLYDESGKLQGFAKVTRNLTERKEHEDNLRAANALLREQQKELQRLNDSKDEFISLASHQLRTPATAVKQLLGLLLEGFEGELPDNIQRIIEKSYESNERQIAIVNSLLRVAQVDAGKVVLHKTVHDINSVINGLLLQHSGVIAERDQIVTWDLPKKPLPGYIDEQYFRMALENILDNASKYTDQGGTIHVRTESRDDFVHVEISDTGVGIPEANMGRLFEKFHRIPNDLSHKISGSGLGLYWVEKIIDLHNGTIGVDSKLGEGTTFHIYVPAGAGDA